MLLPSGRWQHAVIVALRVLPLLAIAVMSLPVWLSWLWLGDSRRADVLMFVEKLGEWLTNTKGD
jgi:hypothetical protein